MYCVVAVAVNLNHCSPFGVSILPLAHSFSVSSVASPGTVMAGVVEDALNVILYVPLKGESVDIFI